MSIKTVENMVTWIEVNITKNPTLAEMSDHVGYSPFYCSNKFHEHVGITFKQYLAKRKLTLAAIEVKNTQTRLLDIAFKYGFSSQESFTRAFVEAYGCSPNQYRKTLISIQLYMKPNFLPVTNNEF